jgi:uncharacterized protein YeaO (DUF488 family)
MIRHASVYDSPNERPDGSLRVLVMRQWPRGIRKARTDLWLKDAGPSRELLNAYNHDGLSWDEFAQRYRSEMAERPDVLERLRALEQEHGTLTLLCHERIPPHAHCHRELLADLLAAETELRVPASSRDGRAPRGRRGAKRPTVGTTGR